jgi:predicted nucleotidyltransferase
VQSPNFLFSCGQVRIDVAGYVRVNLWGKGVEKNDLDVLVSFSETIDLFMFGHLENYLSDILGVKVDLVMKDSLKPCLKDRILNEAVYV